MPGRRGVRPGHVAELPVDGRGGARPALDLLRWRGEEAHGRALSTRDRRRAVRVVRCGTEVPGDRLVEHAPRGLGGEVGADVQGGVLGPVLPLRVGPRFVEGEGTDLLHASADRSRVGVPLADHEAHHGGDRVASPAALHELLLHHRSLGDQLALCDSGQRVAQAGDLEGQQGAQVPRGGHGGVDGVVVAGECVGLGAQLVEQGIHARGAGLGCPEPQVLDEVGHAVLAFFLCRASAGDHHRDAGDRSLRPPLRIRDAQTRRKAQHRLPRIAGLRRTGDRQGGDEEE